MAACPTSLWACVPVAACPTSLSACRGLPYLAVGLPRLGQADQQRHDGGDGQHHGGEVGEVDLGHHQGARVLLAARGRWVHEVQDEAGQSRGLASKHTPESALQRVDLKENPKDNNNSSNNNNNNNDNMIIIILIILILI